MNHPDHICRFNDAPQTCECYDAGYKDGVAEERERMVKHFNKTLMNNYEKEVYGLGGGATN